MDGDIAKIAGQYGIAGILLLVIGWVVYKIGLRLIAAIDRMTARIDAHTEADVAALTALTMRIQNLETKLETKLDGFVERVDDWLDRTPVNGVPIQQGARRERSQPRPAPREVAGEYHTLPRAKSEPGRTKP